MIHKEMVNWTASFSKHYYIKEIPLVISSYRDKAQDSSLNYQRSCNLKRKIERMHYSSLVNLLVIRKLSDVVKMTSIKERRC